MAAKSVAMHANARHDRVQTLQTDLTIKEKELAEVRKRLSELDLQRPAQVVDFLTRACKSRKVLDSVPLAQIGNTVSLFKTAAEEERDKQRLLKKTIAEIELQTRATDAAAVAVEKEFERITAKTGYTTSALAVGSKTGEVPDVDEFEIREMIKRLKERVTQAQVVRKRKTLALTKLSADLESRRQERLRADQLANAVLVGERQIDEHKEILRDLLLKQAELDAQIEAAQEKIDQQTAALLQLDVVSYKQRSAEVVELRRAEDRVLKAQEARLLTLDRRLETIRVVLEAHGLLGPVETIVHEKCTAADLKWSGSGGLNGDEDGLEASLDRYCTIEALAPECEMLPATIYSLFEHDLKHHQRQVRLKTVMVHEKEDTKLALIAKVKDLQLQHEETVDRVHDARERHENELDDRLEDAQAILASHKASFDSVVSKNARLNREIQKARSTSHPQSSPLSSTERQRTQPVSTAPAASSPVRQPRPQSAPATRTAATTKTVHRGAEVKDPCQSGW